MSDPAKIPPEASKEPPKPKGVKVRATELGIFNGSRVRPGQTFELPPEMTPGRWMARASDGWVWDRRESKWVPADAKAKKNGRANWWEPGRPAKTLEQLNAEASKRRGDPAQ